MTVEELMRFCGRSILGACGSDCLDGSARHYRCPLPCYSPIPMIAISPFTSRPVAIGLTVRNYTKLRAPLAGTARSSTPCSRRWRSCRLRSARLIWRSINAAAFLGGLFWWLRVYAPASWTRAHWAWVLPFRDPVGDPGHQFRSSQPAADRPLTGGRRGRWARALELGGGFYRRRLLSQDLSHRPGSAADRHVSAPLHAAIPDRRGGRRGFAVLHAKPLVGGSAARQLVGQPLHRRPHPMGAGNRLPRLVAADSLLPTAHQLLWAMWLFSWRSQRRAAAICMAARWRAGRPQLEVLNTALGSGRLLDDRLRPDDRRRRLHPRGADAGVAFSWRVGICRDRLGFAVYCSPAPPPLPRGYWSA